MWKLKNQRWLLLLLWFQINLEQSMHLPNNLNKNKLTPVWSLWNCGTVLGTSCYSLAPNLCVVLVLKIYSQLVPTICDFTRLGVGHLSLQQTNNSGRCVHTKTQPHWCLKVSWNGFGVEEDATKVDWSFHDLFHEEKQLPKRITYLDCPWSSDVVFPHFDISFSNSSSKSNKTKGWNVFNSSKRTTGATRPLCFGS